MSGDDCSQMQMAGLDRSDGWSGFSSPDLAGSETPHSADDDETANRDMTVEPMSKMTSICGLLKMLGAIDVEAYRLNVAITYQHRHPRQLMHSCLQMPTHARRSPV